MIVQLELWTMWLKTKYIWDNPTRKAATLIELAAFCYLHFAFYVNRFSKIVEIGLSTNLLASLI